MQHSLIILSPLQKNTDFQSVDKKSTKSTQKRRPPQRNVSKFIQNALANDLPTLSPPRARDGGTSGKKRTFTSSRSNFNSRKKKKSGV